MPENPTTEMKQTLGLTGLTMNAMALIAPGAFLWLTLPGKLPMARPRRPCGLASCLPCCCVLPPQSATRKWRSCIPAPAALGIMKNFGLPKTKRITGYTWIQLGICTFTGNASLQNHFYDGESLGAIVHFNRRNSIWIQETFNKLVTVPWYTTTSVGNTWSW